jgi:glyoxylase-like metal-dependent hydrolase (beta-lactamase superfamily II)
MEVPTVGRNVQHHAAQGLVARRCAVVFVLATVFLAGCGPHQELPGVVKRRAASTTSGNVESSPIEYASQWLGSKTLTVAPGVHVLGQLFPSNAYAVETKQGTILIDTGSDESAYALRDCMLSVGLRIDKIRYILITHAHYDHVFGINRLKEISEAVVCAGREDCAVLRAADIDALHSLFPRQPYSGKPIEVDRELEDGDVIELGDTKIHVIGAPGHTRGSVCYLLERDSQRILFSGDVIASLNFGPATYSAHLAPRFRGDAASYLHTINRLIEMKVPDLLLTSHSRQQRRLQTIRMDEESWLGLLEPARKELQALVSRHQKDGADFLDGTIKEIETGLYYLGDLDGIATYCVVEGEQLVVINAPGGTQFAEFLSRQLELLGLPVKSPSLVLLTSEDHGCRSGLASLETAPQVIAPRSVLASLRARGVDAVSHEELERIAPFPIKAIPTDDAISYSFQRGPKQVLVTPKVPRNITFEWTNRQTGKKTVSGLEPQFGDLINELGASQAASESYREMLHELSDLSPDIWLPTLPLTGQNANLYDDDWQATIKENRRRADKFQVR